MKRVIPLHFSAFISALKRDWKYLLWLPAYLLIFLLLERLVTPGHYWDTQLPLDSLIPFCEVFLIPYCLWYFFLVAVGLWLFLRDSTTFRKYMWFLGLTFFLSVFFWVLVPNCQGLRPAVMPRDNFLTRGITLLYQIDTNTNVFPSVHVVGSMGAAWAAWKSPTLRSRKVLRVLLILLAALICISTLFIKQHAVLDVISGLALGLLVGLLVFRPMLEL